MTVRRGGSSEVVYVMDRTIFEYEKCFGLNNDTRQTKTMKVVLFLGKDKKSGVVMV
jgi:hypothetical protein